MELTRRPFALATSLLVIISVLGSPLSRDHGAVTSSPQERTVVLTVKAVDRDGSPVSGAIVNVYRSFMKRRVLPVAPADYQEETGPDGIVRFNLPVKSAENLVLSIEVAREDLQGQTRSNIDFGKTPPAYLPLQQFTLRPKAGDVENSTGISLKVIDDKGNPVDGVQVRIQALIWGNRSWSGTTASDGSATIQVRNSFDPNSRSTSKMRWNISASKQGYKSGAATIAMGVDDIGRTVDAGEITLERTDESDVAVTVTVTDEQTKNPVSGATVELQGPSSNSAITDGSGKVTMRVAGLGDYTVSISKEDYYSGGGSFRILKDETAKAEEFTLKPHETSANDTLDVSVLWKDTTDENAQASPLAGARVTDGRTTVVTDAGGRATMKGVFDGEYTVTATAEGYQSQAKGVSVHGTGSINFTLEPELSEKSPLRLIVEVQDSDGKKVRGADVDFYSAAGTLLYAGVTNAEGKRDFKSSDAPGVPVPALRRGLTVTVKAKDFKEVRSFVSPDLLKPSRAASTYLVQLKKSWDELRKAVDALEQSVLAWNNDVALAGQATALVRRLAEEAPGTKAKADALLQEFESAAANAKGSVNGVSRCKLISNLRTNIQGYRVQADAREQALRTLLDNASAVIATCASEKDAEAVKTIYRSATEIARGIAELETKAKQANKALNDLGSEQSQSSDAVDGKLAELEELANQAETAAKTTGTYFLRAQNLSNALGPKHGALTNQLTALKAKFALDGQNPADDVPRDLMQRIEQMTQLLGKRNSDVFSGPNQEWLSTVQEAATQIQANVAKAKSVVSQSKNAQCNTQPMDQVVQEIGAIKTSAIVELAAAALNEKAENCINKNACNAARSEARGLLEQGAIETAEPIIQSARAKGCDVTGLNEEVDYWKTVRDGAIYLKGLTDQCKFQDALDWSTKLPDSVRHRPLLVRAVTEALNGLKAQQEIERLRAQAKTAVARSQQAASAVPFIEKAEQVAQPYPCMVKRVAQFKDEYKITTMVDDPSVYSGIGVITIPTSPPEVEEIPDSAIKYRPKPLNEERPQVEDIPEAVRPSKPRTEASSASTDTNTNTATPPGVRPCTEDEKAAFAKISGSFKSYRMNITIGGSCEQVTGTYTVAEWCAGVNEEGSGKRSVTGTFKGRMNGGYLSVTYEQPASPSGHPARKGSGSCSADSDGTFSCGGFGCQSEFKRE